MSHRGGCSGGDASRASQLSQQELFIQEKRKKLQEKEDKAKGAKDGDDPGTSGGASAQASSSVGSYGQPKRKMNINFKKQW